jgi:hypothetical protein
MEPIKQPVKQPEELRQEYALRQQKLEREADLRRKVLIIRWTWASAVLGLLAALFNYLGFGWICVLHMAFCALMANLLLRYRRGHLTGTIVFGFGNSLISFFYLYAGPGVVLGFNPFGLLAFCLIGAMVGIGMRVERYHDM